MEENAEQFKITEARYLMIIPLLITGACAALDIVTNFKYGNFQCMGWYEFAHTIFRCIIGYFFPSVLSLVIVMLWQQRVKREDIFGIRKETVGYCAVITVVIGIVFIICLILCYWFTDFIFLICMIAYGKSIYSCLNEKVKGKRKEDKTQEELLLDLCTPDKQSKS